MHMFSRKMSMYTITRKNSRFMIMEVTLETLRYKNINEIQIKYFQMNDFEKIYLYVIEVVTELESRF